MKSNKEYTGNVFYSLLIFLKDCCVYIVTAALTFFLKIAPLLKTKHAVNEKNQTNAETNKTVLLLTIK